jgi:hypothetical protein
MSRWDNVVLMSENVILVGSGILCGVIQTVAWLLIGRDADCEDIKFGLDDKLVDVRMSDTMQSRAGRLMSMLCTTLATGRFWAE